MKENTFQVSVDKACPACSQSCPGFETDFVDFYADFNSDKPVERSIFCKNQSLCMYLWNYLEKHNDSLESH